MELDGLGQYREGNRLEAKAAQGRDGLGELPRSIWETLSAFANTSGGLIVLGVRELEDRTFDVVGIENPDKVLDDFWNAAMSDDKVSARFLQDSDATIEMVDGKSIVALNVPRAERHIRPVYINGDLFRGTYRRMHTGDHLCTREEVLSMLRDSATSSQDAEVADSGLMEYLDDDTVAKYRRRFDSLNSNHVWSDFDDERFLEAIGAAKPDGNGELRPTCAGLLMFGEDRFIKREFPHYLLDYRQETGDNERWEDRLVSFSGDWTGNVYDFYFRAYNKLKAALKVPFKLEGADRIDDTPAHRALREALVNCLTNANWHERRGVVCVWREDAITIENPGDFRMPIEEAMKPGKSDPRNETLLSMFALVDAGERAGSGMDKIFTGWKSSGFPEPAYAVEYGPDRSILTLPLADSSTYSSGYSSSGSKDWKNSGSIQKTSDERKAEILSYLKANGPAGRTAVATAMGYRGSWASKLLSEMVEDGAIIPIGSGKNRVYDIKRS